MKVLITCPPMISSKAEYIDFFKNNNIEISEMINKILNGINENEVKLVQKIQKKSGFSEKFFQLFS